MQTMVETRLANAGFSGVGVMYTGKTPMSATEKEAHSDISENGNITYFYTDLTTTDLTTTLQRFDTYKASFRLILRQGNENGSRFGSLFTGTRTRFATS